MAKYVTIICDNCRQPFIQDAYWTPIFKMDTGPDICIHCRIIKGEDVSQ